MNKQEFRYKIKDESGLFDAGEKVAIVGSQIAVENPDGSALMFFPVLLEYAYKAKELDPDREVTPLIVPADQIEDALVLQDYADMFNEDSLEDVARLKWLKGNPQLALTLVITPEEVYATNHDPFIKPLNGTALPEIRFNFSKGFTRDDVLTN